MSTQRKKLIEIQYVTDCDTDMYRMGETDFSYNTEELEAYLHRYGSEDILKTLNYFIAEVIELRRRAVEDDSVAEAG